MKNTLDKTRQALREEPETSIESKNNNTPTYPSATTTRSWNNQSIAGSQMPSYTVSVE